MSNKDKMQFTVDILTSIFSNSNLSGMDRIKLAPKALEEIYKKIE